MRILYSLPAGQGWDSVTLMAELAAEFFEAELVVLDGARPTSFARRLASFAPRVRGKGHCLVIAPHPAHLQAILRSDHLFRGFDHVAAWVIDAFWDDRIPAVARHGHFDQFFVTDEEVVESWNQSTGVPTSWLPFGSDVLGMGSCDPDRPTDLQRYGRQPGTWENDESTRDACAAAGLRFKGRPPFGEDPLTNQQGAMDRFAHAKYTLSFTNRVSPAAYTHPTREYMTARWTDALASGAVVAGIPPNCAAARELLWPEAVLELATVDRDSGIALIAEAVRAWHPGIAATNHLRALERLDWRWRFRDLAEAMSVAPERLNAELAQLEDTIRIRSGGSIDKKPA